MLFDALNPEVQEPDRLRFPDFMKVEPGSQSKSIDPAPTFFPLFLKAGLLGSPRFSGPSLTLVAGVPVIVFLEVMS